ncbi:MAG: FAD-dependent oxidoreductase [Bdellovibrionota bacterium]
MYRIEQKSILASTFCSQKFPHRASDDRVLLRVFMGGAMQEDICQECDKTLFHLAKTDLREILGYKGDPIYQNIIRWPHAMPQYKVGHQNRVSQFFESVRNFEEICFLGNSFSGVGIPDLIQKSKDTIEGLLA